MAQASLDGFDPPPPRLDRLFFALFPDPATAAHVTQLSGPLRDRQGLKGKLLDTGRLHVTLQHIDDYAGLPPAVVDAAKQAASTVRAEPFELVFDHAMSFDKRSNPPFVLRGDDGGGLAAVVAFQQRLVAALRKTVLGRMIKAGFTPHMTLMYGDHVAPRQDIEPVRWTAHEFVLVHSLIGQKIHLPLARWPLAG